MQEPSPPISAGAIYERAESLYSQGRYDQAAQEFLRYVAMAYPDDALVDNAYFKTGMSMFEQGRYRDALYYFQTVTQRYPSSELAVEALINTGICHYHLNEPDEADSIFSQAISRGPVPKEKAYINFYRALIAEDAGAYKDATGLYVESERVAEDQRLIETARSRTERIMHNFLGEEDMLELAERYRGQWPARLAFEELVNIYRRSGDQAALGNIMRKKEEQFPAKARASAEAAVPAKKKAVAAPARPKIGVVAPLTGRGAQAGREIVQGIQLAFSSFHDLILEKDIQLIIKDSASDPINAETATEELAEDDDTIVILGPAFSRSLERASRMAGQYQVPIFSPSASAEGLAAMSDKIFRNAMTNSIEGRKVAELAVDKLGLYRFAVLYPDSLSGWEIFESFKNSVENLGGLIAVEKRYNPQQTDFGEQIRDIGGKSDEELRLTILSIAETFPEAEPEYINFLLQERHSDSLTVPRIEKFVSLPLTEKNFLPALSIKYDAVFIIGGYEKVGLILPELEFYNIKGITKLSGRSANNPELVRIAERYAEGLIFLDGFFRDSASPIVRAFNRSYKLAFREEPTILSAQAYDAARIVLSAMAHGAGDRNAMAEYLRSLERFEGVCGLTSMDHNGDADKTPFYLTIENRKIVEYTPAPPEETEPAPEAEPSIIDAQ